MGAQLDERREDAPELSRVCAKCGGDPKPLSAFVRYWHGGYQPYCRACNAEQLREARERKEAQAARLGTRADGVTIHAGRGVAYRRHGTAERAIRALLAEDPDTTLTDILMHTDIPKTTAAEWLKKIRAERAQATPPPAPAPRIDPEWLPDAEPPAPAAQPAPVATVAPALVLDFGPSYPTYTVNEWIMLSEGLSVLQLDGGPTLQYAPCADGGPCVYLLSPDRPGAGPMLEPLSLGWLDAIAKIIDGQGKPLRGRAWFQARR